MDAKSAKLVLMGLMLLSGCASHLTSRSPAARNPTGQHDSMAKTMPAPRLIGAIIDRDGAEALALIKEGADVNAHDFQGNTPLYFAVTASGGGMLEVMKALLDRGADVNARCIGGCSPLHSACNFGGIDEVQFLIANGADVNAKDAEGITPLHVAVSGFCHDPRKVIGLLSLHNAQIDAADKNGKTPLDWAREMPRVDGYNASHQLTTAMRELKSREKGS